MVTKKDRRHSGYVTPKALMSNRDLIDNCLFINPFYDDWEDYRDGFRDWFRDFKRIKRVAGKSDAYSELFEKRLRMNRKQKLLLKRRKARKNND